MASNPPQTQPNPLPDRGFGATDSGRVLPVVRKCFPNPGPMV